MLLGVLSVIAACFCWGLIFIAPKFVPSFSPIEIALGRFFFFGLVSLAIISTIRRHLFQKTYLFAWKKAFWYGFISTIGSYLGVVFCARYASPAVAALIYGMSPITIALFGNIRKREYAFKNFLLPCSLIAIGLVLVNLNAFDLEGARFEIYLLGLVIGLLGLGSWTFFTVANSSFLKQNKNLAPNDWLVIMGVATFALVLLGWALNFCFSPEIRQYSSLNADLKVFLIVSLVLGTISSWGAFFFWNHGSVRLPISLAGQLTIFEMIFGLLFVYLVEQRLPTLVEITGIVIMTAGVLTAFKTLKKISENEPA